MRRFLKRPVIAILTALARAVLRRYRPTIIAVAGSVGKTTTREAIFTVLHGSAMVWEAHGSLNSELGTPLAIFGIREAPAGAGGWLRAVGRGWGLLLRRQPYPELLVLEFGEDHPGDIAWLTRLAPPTVGVVTSIAPAHLSYFKSVDAITEEMRAFVTAVPEDGFVVLNADDPRVAALADDAVAPVAFVGFSKTAEVRASDVVLELARRTLDVTRPGTTHRLTAKVTVGTEHHHLVMPDFIAPHQLMSALAAFAVGRSFGVDVATLLKRLATLKPQRGRMRLLVGRNGSWLIDDTYNASPTAVHAALNVLKKFPGAKRRIVVLGAMSELGTAALAAHDEVGAAVAEVADRAVFVAASGMDIEAPAERYRAAAEAAGLKPAAIAVVPDASAAGEWLVENVKLGDVVLVKGSQVVRLERAVAQVLADPTEVPQVLCRQGAFWRGRG